MKYALAFLAMVTALAGIGCHAQIPPNPTVTTCPASTSGYTPLNQATPATGLTYTWTPAAGTYCVIAQSVLGSNSSQPSNIAGPFTATGAAKTATWLAPTSGPTPSGYVLSIAPAIQQTLGAPALGPTVALNSPPSPKPAPTDAKVAAPSGLTLAEVDKH